MPNKNLNDENKNPHQGLSTIEYFLLEKMKEASKEFISPKPLHYSLVYFIGGCYYLTRNETKQILKKLASWGLIELKRNGVVLKKTSGDGNDGE